MQHDAAQGHLLPGSAQRSVRTLVGLCTRELSSESSGISRMPDKMVGNWLRLDGDKFREAWLAEENDVESLPHKASNVSHLVAEPPFFERGQDNS